MTKFHHPTICRIARHLALAIFGFGLLGSVQPAFAQTGCAAGGGGATGGGRAIGRMGANGGLAAQGVQGGQQGLSQVQQLMMVQQFQQSQQRQQEMQQARDEAMRRQQAVASIAQMNRPKVQSQRKSTAERAAERREMYFRAREAKLAKSQQMDDSGEPDDQESPTIANTIAVVLDE